MFNKIKNMFTNKNDDDDKDNKKSMKGYIAIIGLMGLLLLLLGNILTPAENKKSPENNMIEPTNQNSKSNKVAESTHTSNYKELEEAYKKELEEMLENIQGVSDVEVMVNLDSTDVKVYEKNLISGKQITDENDKNGGTRQIEDNTKETQIVVVRQGDQETPLLIQTKKPDVRGVFIVAKGVDHATVKKWVVEAVSRVLDVPTHRVSVMPKK